MSNKELAKNIVDLLGGKNNIKYAVHCITRLRFNLNDPSKANIKQIENLDGVMGVQVQNGQYQVIIGSHVASVFAEVKPLLNNEMNQNVNENSGKFSPSMIIEVIAGIFSPIIPALVGAGMLKGVLALLVGFKFISGTGGTYQVFDMISDTAFYFLPFLLAISASRKFKVNEYLGICVAGSLMYPTIINAVGVKGVKPIIFMNMAVPIFKYADSVFPIILGILLLSITYHLFDRIIPNIFKLVLVPMISLAITIPLTLLFLAPIGAWCGIGLANSIVWVFTKLGPFAGFLLGFFMPLIVLCGMHQSTSPIQLQNISTLGYDYLLPISFCHNMAESGAAFGVGLKSKNKALKSIAFSTSFSAFLGISEPALFTINVRKKRPLICTMIGNGIGGFLTTLLGVKCFAFVMPGITSLPVYANPNGNISNILMMIICIASTFVMSAILVLVLGFKDDPASDVNNDEEIILSPVKGRLIPLSDVKDNVFSSGKCGKGIAIVPEGGSIVAPCDATVVAVMEHGIGLKTNSGKEILIHVGINTIELKGKYFTPKVKQGEKVRCGQELLRFESKEIAEAGYDLTTMVLCTNATVKSEKKSGNIAKLEQAFIIQ
ncbi:MAG TPA: PTS beta-glucoside transporter subunit EIIBCA [Clostridiaceae bacterium]|nr:PTS beta-glucoside transporter subunit EIIBCA [Clostridiaceae bacterium]